MKHAILMLALALPAAPALAQATEEDQRAYALILPMFQEMFPGYHGQVLATCVVNHAAPEEKAAMAAAPAPSTEIGQLVNVVLGREDTIACVKTTLGL